MDLNSVLPVEGGRLTVNAATAPGPVLADQLTRLTNAAPIVIERAVRTVANGTVTVKGRSTLLHARNVNVIATAQGSAVTIRFNLIEGQPVSDSWRFSRSFPDLPPFYA